MKDRILMDNKLFIIGNGFDLAHRLPTRFDPDFREIAEKNESNPYFWELYQSTEPNIWSDFENLLAKPDFNSLAEIFEYYAPDYSSDRESDRDGIILEAEMSGNLKESLEEFANQAEGKLANITPQRFFEDLFTNGELYINFNYTHTLEQVYGIEIDRVLHVHGEAGNENLLLGYPEGDFSPEDIHEDIRQKGRGPYRDTSIKEYINSLEDYYVRTAHEILINKVESFKKEFKIELVEEFLSGHKLINEIIVYGHSCAIDFPYFEYLNVTFPLANWKFFSFDERTIMNIEMMVCHIGIRNYSVVEK